MALVDQIVMQREIAHSQSRRLLHPKIGYVTSYDPKNYTVRVRLEPESSSNEAAGVENPVVETGWIPLLRMYGGNGWGVVAPPKASSEKPYGDQVLIIFHDNGYAVALNGLFNAVEKPLTASSPSPSDDNVPASSGDPKWGEYWLVHPSGAFLKLRNDGTATIAGNKNNQCYIKWNTNGSISIQGSNTAGFQISQATPVGPPGTSTDDNAIVTRGDLQKFYTDLIAKVLAQCQTKSTTGADISGITVIGSTTITATD